MRFQRKIVRRQDLSLEGPVIPEYLLDSPFGNCLMTAPDCFRYERLAQGKALWREGDQCCRLTMILEGELSLSKWTGCGRSARSGWKRADWQEEGILGVLSSG